MNIRIAVVFLAGLLLGTAVHASPMTLPPLTPTADGYASGASWAAIDKIGDILKVDSASAAGGEFRSALEFDITSIPAGMEIISATLILFEHKNSMPTPTIDVHGYTGDGDIQAGDFAVNNKIAEFISDALPDETRVDVTSFVQGEYAAGNQYAGFQLREVDQFHQHFHQQQPEQIRLRPPSGIGDHLPAGPARTRLIRIGRAGCRRSGFRA